jgi:hypothetical protein
VGDRTFKVHLDGYNQLDLITGKGHVRTPGDFTSGFDVIVDGLRRSLRQLKPDGPTGLPLPHRGLRSNRPKDRSGWGRDATVFQRSRHNEQLGQNGTLSS